MLQDNHKFIQVCFNRIQKEYKTMIDSNDKATLDMFSDNAGNSNSATNPNRELKSLKDYMPEVRPLSADTYKEEWFVIKGK